MLSRTLIGRRLLASKTVQVAAFPRAAKGEVALPSAFAASLDKELNGALVKQAELSATTHPSGKSPQALFFHDAATENVS